MTGIPSMGTRMTDESKRRDPSFFLVRSKHWGHASQPTDPGSQECLPHHWKPLLIH
jgi:hypothetical protein